MLITSLRPPTAQVPHKTAQSVQMTRGNFSRIMEKVYRFSPPGRAETGRLRAPKPASAAVCESREGSPLQGCAVRVAQAGTLLGAFFLDIASGHKRTPVGVPAHARFICETDAQTRVPPGRPHPLGGRGELLVLRSLGEVGSARPRRQPRSPTNRACAPTAGSRLKSRPQIALDPQRAIPYAMTHRILELNMRPRTPPDSLEKQRSLA